MDPEDWNEIVSGVTDQMRRHTRSLVTPLSTSSEDKVRLVGSGSYVCHRGQRYLLTCEHVEREGPMDHQFYGSDRVFRCQIPFVKQPHPIDAAATLIGDEVWNSLQHEAACIPYARFADRHQLADRSELLFFRGYAGENAHYGFGILESNGSGYCSQEKEIATPDPQLFEIFWEPDKIAFSSGTTADSQKNIKADDPHGYSGSLVWNTRFVERRMAGAEWSPDDAVVTGLLRRWDDKTKTLLVFPVEHLKAWLEQKVFV